MVIVSSEEGSVLNESLVKKALLYMKKRHPLFRANLVHEKTTKLVNLNIESKYSDEINLEWSLVDCRKSLIKELEIFSSRLFDYDSKCLLWRCKVIEFLENDCVKYAIVIILPLFITDGINITAITFELVNIINSISNNKECEEMKTQLDLVDNLHVNI